MKYRRPIDAETPELGRIAAQTFGFPLPSFDTFVNRVGHENLRVAISADEVAGGLAVYRLDQWFGGRSVDMAGVALVCVPPERRSTGVARFMMSSLLHELHDQGIPLATLFASTQQPYRRVGFEQAGTWNQYEMSMTQIGHQESPLPLHQVDLLNATPFSAVAEKRSAISNGNLTRSPGIWDRLIKPQNSAFPMLGYLIGDVQRPQGYIIFEQIMRPTIEDRYLQVRDMVALTAPAHESLWAFLYGHRSIFPSLRWYGPPLDPLLMSTREARAQPVFNERWMLRMVDVPRALSQRGYPASITGTLDVSITDELIPENHGRFRLEFKNGKARVSRGGTGELQIDVRGLSSLYTSLFDATTLQGLGCIVGPSKTIEMANAIFAGPQPWMPDKF